MNAILIFHAFSPLGEKRERVQYRRLGKYKEWSEAKLQLNKTWVSLLLGKYLIIKQVRKY